MRPRRLNTEDSLRPSYEVIVDYIALLCVIILALQLFWGLATIVWEPVIAKLPMDFVLRRG